MISIIVNVHNQLGMNQLFFEYLKKNTKNKYELIIIDNNSKDGSREFFEKYADKVICNEHNYSYPYCQNQGIKEAKFKYLAFFNNDIIVSKNWDESIMKIMDDNRIDAISFNTNDSHIKSPYLSRKLNSKWKKIKYPLLALFGSKKWNLKFMFSLMYNDWDVFNAENC